MIDPYTPPKTVQKPAPARWDIFDRVQKYQYRAFYGGLITAILCTILSAVVDEPLMKQVFFVIGSLGSFCVIVSLGSILPLSVWGFIRGYRESRRS